MKGQAVGAGTSIVRGVRVASIEFSVADVVVISALAA
jgi:hypothetical protein